MEQKNPKLQQGTKAPMKRQNTAPAKLSSNNIDEMLPSELQLQVLKSLDCNDIRRASQVLTDTGLPSLEDNQEGVRC